MKQQFDINKIIEQYKLNIDDVAEALFPHVRYKMLALRRVLNGEAYLNTQQLEILAKLAGVFIQDLFLFDQWKGKIENGLIVMTHGEFTVKLNYNNTFMTLLKGSQIIAQELTCPKNTSIDDFINHINKIIKNYGTN